jgi:hypothetical protein
MRRIIGLLSLALLLGACGGQAPPSEAQVFATIGAELNPPTSAAPSTPTTAPAPTLTATELNNLTIVANRLMLMRRAAEDLQEFTARGSAEGWQSHVGTWANILSGARGGIHENTLPEQYQSPRLTEVIDRCAALGETIAQIGQLSTFMAQRKELTWCVNSLRPLEFVYTDYTQ